MEKREKRLFDNAGAPITAMVTVGDVIYVASGSRVFCYDTKVKGPVATQMSFFRLPDDGPAPGSISWPG